MHFELEICLDKNRWNDFVLSSPHGSVFCLIPFLDALGEDYDLLMLRGDGKIMLGAVVLKKNNDSLQAPYPFALYQGVMLGSVCESLPLHSKSKFGLELMDAFLTQASACYRRLSFCQHYDFKDGRGFQWFHYHEPQFGQFVLSVGYTGVLDLSKIVDFNSYISVIRENRRREYKKALNAGLVIEASDDIRSLVHLHDLTFQRQGVEISEQERKLVPAITHAALENGFGTLLFCRDQHGTPMSASLFLFDNRSAYYLIGANDPKFRNSGSATYLMLEQIRRCIERDMQHVDFAGINSPNRGDYKCSLNAAPIPYLIATWEEP